MWLHDLATTLTPYRPAGGDSRFVITGTVSILLFQPLSLGRMCQSHRDVESS